MMSLILCLNKIITNDSNLTICYRVDEKTKKYCNPFVKASQPSPSGIYNMNVTTSVSNCSQQQKSKHSSSPDLHWSKHENEELRVLFGDTE